MMAHVVLVVISFSQQSLILLDADCLLLRQHACYLYTQTCLFSLLDGVQDPSIVDLGVMLNRGDGIISLVVKYVVY